MQYTSQQLHLLGRAIALATIANLLLSFLAIDTRSVYFWLGESTALILICVLVYVIGRQYAHRHQYLDSQAAITANAQELLHITQELAVHQRPESDERPLLTAMLHGLTQTLGMAYGAVLTTAPDEQDTLSVTAVGGADPQACTTQELLARVANCQHKGGITTLQQVDAPACGTLKTLVLVPLGDQETTFGVLALGFTTEASLSPEEMETLKLLGRQLSLILHNHRLQVQLAEVSRQLSKNQAPLMPPSIADPLTGLMTRQAFTDHISSVIAKVKHTPEGQLSVLMVDADHLHAINERFGMATGDEALCRIAEVLQGGIRGWDVAARIGGDEFCVLLPSTGGIAAVTVAERLRDQIAGITLGEANEVICLTACFGVASLSSDVTDVDGLFAKAYESLLEGKRAGGNQVMIDWDTALEGIAED